MLTRQPHPLPRLLRAIQSDRGTAAVSFILCFPIFLTVVAVVVQFALVANARLVVEHACHAAARAASTSLPDQQSDNIRKAALMALAQISPEAKTAADPEAIAITEALRDCSTGISTSYANRYTYAMDAARVSWDSNRGDYLHSSQQDVQVTVRYRFKLTVPVAAAMLSGGKGSIAGVDGRFYELVSTRTVQSSPGRRVSAEGDGWPRQ